MQQTDRNLIRAANLIRDGARSKHAFESSPTLASRDLGQTGADCTTMRIRPCGGAGSSPHDGWNRNSPAIWIDCRGNLATLRLQFDNECSYRQSQAWETSTVTCSPWKRSLNKSSATCRLRKSVSRQCQSSWQAWNLARFKSDSLGIGSPIRTLIESLPWSLTRRWPTRVWTIRTSAMAYCAKETVAGPFVPRSTMVGFLTSLRSWVNCWLPMLPAEPTLNSTIGLAGLAVNARTMFPARIALAARAAMDSYAKAVQPAVSAVMQSIVRLPDELPKMRPGVLRRLLPGM